MLMWTSGFQNPLVHTDFNMFVDECYRNLCTHMLEVNILVSCSHTDLDSSMLFLAFLRKTWRHI